MIKTSTSALVASSFSPSCSARRRRVTGGHRGQAYGELRHSEAELEQFAVKARRATERSAWDIVRTKARTSGLIIRPRSRPTLPSPEQAEALTVPPNDRRWLHG
jgi:hypothetical protein